MCVPLNISPEYKSTHSYEKIKVGKFKAENSSHL